MEERDCLRWCAQQAQRDSAMHTSTVTSSQGLGFINGGWDFSTSGMVIFNASNPRQLSWTNQTGDEVPGTMGASMQYARYGKAGVLIGIGGNNVLNQIVELLDIR